MHPESRTSYEDITGIVTYTFGFYAIQPLTALNLTVPSNPTVKLGEGVTERH
jgi:hypothetical protein